VGVNKEDISCPICADILYKPVETYCGHAFCEACLANWLPNHPTACPMCKKNPQPVHPSYTLRNICEQYYKQHPNQAGLEMREKEIGNDCYQKQQYWKAIEHYTQAIQSLGEAHNKAAVLYSNRSQCYIKLFKYSHALADCEKALSLIDNPHDAVKVRVRKGKCLMHQGDLESSLAEFQLAAKLDTTGTFALEIRQCIDMLPPPQELPNTPSPSPSSSNSTIASSCQTPYVPPSSSHRRPRRRKPKCIIM